MQTVFITGAAGFIGFHLSELLLQEGFRVAGYDALTDYYDPKLKQARMQILGQHEQFRFQGGGWLEDKECLYKLTQEETPDVIVHLAAQAGVRYSLENPSAYIQSNVVGTFQCDGSGPRAWRATSADGLYQLCLWGEHANAICRDP